MPSLARKSMKMMREAYNLAANYDRPPKEPPPVPSVFQPWTTLSPQFPATNTQPYPTPPSPFLQPSTSHSQLPPLVPPPQSTPYLSPTPGPTQPYNSWSNGST